MAAKEHWAKISTDQKFEACRKQLRLIGLVASIDPESSSSTITWLSGSCSCRSALHESAHQETACRTLSLQPAALAFAWCLGPQVKGLVGFRALLQAEVMITGDYLLTAIAIAKNATCPNL